MTNPTTDSPISRRIVRAFLDFLDSVEPAPGVDLEGLEIAKDCLIEVFGLRQLPESERPEPNVLVNTFSSQEREVQGVAEASHSEVSHGRSSTHDFTNDGPSAALKAQDDGRAPENCDTGVSKDELCGQFFDALEKTHFFRASSNGEEDNVLLDKATCLFHDAVDEIERSECKTFDRKNLADALKTLGNKTMQAKAYSDAIERYTCAIALCENNAVYYCNRAAAYTQMHKYNEAVQDCLKSIEIDPNYSKAYSRLGLAYYAQGNYKDAIHKGFRKALVLDPNNDAVKENIQVAEQKLRELQEQRHRFQGSMNHPPGGSGSQSAPPPFASMSFDTGNLPANFASMFSNIAGNASQNHNQQNRPEENTEGPHPSTTSRSFDGSAIPPNIANMFMNLAGNAFHGQDSQTTRTSEPNNGNNGAPSNGSALPSEFASMFMNMAGQGSQGQNSGPSEGDGNVSGFNDLGIGGGANISFNFGDQAPEDLSRTLQSVMGMFTDGVQGDPPGTNGDGRPTP